MKTITKNHLAIGAHRFFWNVRAGRDEAARGDLNVKEVAPDYERFRALLEEVGGPWGWTCQERYREGPLRRRLGEPETRLLMLREGEREIGYALIVGVGQAIKDRFWPVANQPSVIEIENLGLFPGEEGSGRGWSFFEMIMTDLFESHDVVYWTMSSTNYPTLLDYYRRHGMQLLAQDEVPDPRYKQVPAPTPALVNG